jgi:hypothetical protein
MQTDWVSSIIAADDDPAPIISAETGRRRISFAWETWNKTVNKTVHVDVGMAWR